MARKRISLIRCVGIYTALTVTGLTALHSFFHHYLAPRYPMFGHMLDKGWHIVGLGGLTFLVFMLVLNRKVVRPIHLLYQRFYPIARGDIQPVHVDSRIEEIHDILVGVNMLVARIRHSDQNIHQELAVLKNLIRKHEDGLSGADGELMRQALDRIERQVTNDARPAHPASSSGPERENLAAPVESSLAC